MLMSAMMALLVVEIRWSISAMRRRAASASASVCTSCSVSRPAYPAALRVKESVMTTVNTVQENAADILASAQDINQARTAQEEAVEDTAAETQG